MTTKKEPDGYFQRGFEGTWDIRSGTYVDELAGKEDFKSYEPVIFISPERLKHLEEIEQSYMNMFLQNYRSSEYEE